MHLVVACDGAPDGLRELLQGVTNQSVLGGFEVRVVELVPHVIDGRDELLLVPQTRVRTEIVSRTAVNVVITHGQPKPGVEVTLTQQDEVAEAVRRTEAGVVREPKPGLAAAIAAYDANADLDLRTRGTAWNYRQIRPPSWPGRLHYEFFSYSGDAMGVELHLEGDTVAPFREILEPLALKLRDRFPSITWDPRWSAGRGRLQIRLQDAPASVVAETMTAFIEETRPILEAAIAERGL